MKIEIPVDVKRIINTLENSGYKAYIVGGCVRDSILGIVPADWDVATSAKVDDIKECFSDYRHVDSGVKHGTVGVILNGVNYEITTFRIDGNYSDCRHPESVIFTDDINADLSRRDFTINAMAYNDSEGLIDPFNGLRDLSLNALRCVGDPDLRFKEDALRIMRALRFASTYNLNIEVKTSHALVMNKALLNNISVERISSELVKLLCGTNVSYILRRYKDVVSTFLPELVSTFDFEQNTPHHNKTVWKHTTASVALIQADPVLRMTMLFHDTGKPIALSTDEKGIDHFYGHNRFSCIYAEMALDRLKYPKSFINQVLTLIEYHDIRFSDNKRQIKHVLNKIGVEAFRNLLKVQRADILAQSKYKREIKLNNLLLAERTLEEIIEEEQCFMLKDLKINGSDLIHIGITNGVHIGKILNRLLENVIDDDIENEPVVLKKSALRIYNEILKNPCQD